MSLCDWHDRKFRQGINRGNFGKGDYHFVRYYPSRQRRSECHVRCIPCVVQKQPWPNEDGKYHASVCILHSLCKSNVFCCALLFMGKRSSAGFKSSTPSGTIQWSAKFESCWSILSKLLLVSFYLAAARFLIQLVPELFHLWYVMMSSPRLPRLYRFTYCW